MIRERDAIKIEKIAVFQQNHLVRVRIAGAQRHDVIWMIAILSKGMDRVGMYPVARIVRARQRHFENVGEIQICLAKDETAVAQVNLKAINRAFVLCRHAALAELGNDNIVFPHISKYAWMLSA